MSNVTSEYHRTFKALRPQSMREMMSQASLNRRMRELEEEYKKNKGFGKNNASTSAVSRPTYEAFEYIGEQLSSVLIETKEDQRFGAFATPWEVAWSRLTSFQDRRFFPVVDSNGTVIGHIGEVSSDNLLIANETWTVQHQFPHKDALKYYRMFVGPKALHGRSDLEKYAAASPFQNYSVLSTIDGEVMAFSLKNFNTERSLQSVSLLEIAGWISVAGLGGKILLSLGARGFRTLMRMTASLPGKTPPPIPKKVRPVNDTVNVGGGGEFPNVTNLNPVNPISGGPAKGIPNHVPLGMEKMDTVFEPGSVKKMISNKLRYWDVDWPTSTRAAAKVMPPGGQVSMNIWTTSQTEIDALQVAFTKAGFEVKVINGTGSGTMVIGKRL